MVLFQGGVLKLRVADRGRARRGVRHPATEVRRGNFLRRGRLPQRAGTYVRVEDYSSCLRI